MLYHISDINFKVVNVNSIAITFAMPNWNETMKYEEHKIRAEMSINLVFKLYTIKLLGDESNTNLKISNKIRMLKLMQKSNSLYI